MLNRIAKEFRMIAFLQVISLAQTPWNIEGGPIDSWCGGFLLAAIDYDSFRHSQVATIIMRKRWGWAYVALHQPWNSFTVDLKYQYKRIYDCH